MNPEQQQHYEQPPTPEVVPVSVEQQEAEPVVPPRVWVASLTDHLSGVVHGAWIDAAREEAELQADVDAMLAASPVMARTGRPAVRWAITRAEGFGQLALDEDEDLHWLSLVGKGIAKHGLAFAAYADVVQLEEVIAGFDAAYLGHYDSVHVYLEQLINDLAYDHIMAQALPARVRPYVKIDITATANDLLRGGDLLALPAPDGGVWLFR